MNKLKRWNRKRLFIKAYKILRNESELHRGSGHDVDFRALNTAFVILACRDCPDLYPDGPRKVI